MRNAHSFDRTYEELKQGSNKRIQQPANGFDRTYEELKRRYLESLDRDDPEF